MREYKCTDLSDLTVDLDDPKTYEHLSQNWKELDDLMFEEIGKALVYMDFFHKEWYPVEKNGKHEAGYQQRVRVMSLIKNFASNRQNNYGNIIWFQEQVFLFQDETENMC